MAEPNVIRPGVYMKVLGTIPYYRRVTRVSGEEVAYLRLGKSYTASVDDFSRWGGEHIPEPSSRGCRDYSKLSHFERQMAAEDSYLTYSQLVRRGWPPLAILRWMPDHDTFDMKDDRTPVLKWSRLRVEAAERVPEIVETLGYRIRSKHLLAPNQNPTQQKEHA